MSRLLAALALLSLWQVGCKGDTGAAETGSTAPAPIVTVGPENVVVAQMEELRSGPTISGSLQPEQEATVRAEISGSVERVFAEAGQRVRRGQVLARLDQAAVRDAYLSARSGVRTAESALEIARRNQERAERLARAGALPERDLETARINTTSAIGTLADARARLASATKQLDNTVVRAPFDGIVSDRPVDAGDVVQVGAALFSIVDPSSLRLEAQVPAEQVGRLRTGTPVEFTVSGFDRRFTGRIERINPVVDPSTRQVRIYVAIPNTGRQLVAGLFAEGRVATESKRALAIPVTAVDTRGTNPVVHRLRGGQVNELPVRLGVRDEAAELVEIQSGLSEGDTVLMGSAQGVTDGSRVRVRQEEAAR